MGGREVQPSLDRLVRQRVYPFQTPHFSNLLITRKSFPSTRTLPKVVDVASNCGRTRLIKKRENVYCSDWFNFLLLLRTLTVWYSHNRKRQRHNQIWKKMEKFWFVWLCRVYYLLACLAHSLGPPILNSLSRSQVTSPVSTKARLCWRHMDYLFSPGLSALKSSLIYNFEFNSPVSN